jgi:hypothetical protein
LNVAKDAVINYRKPRVGFYCEAEIDEDTCVVKLLQTLVDTTDDQVYIAVQRPANISPGLIKNKYVEWFQFSKRVEEMVFIIPISSYVCNIRVFDWDCESLVMVDDMRCSLLFYGFI